MNEPVGHLSSGQLQAYCDRRLNREEEVQIRAHLKQCPSCTALYKSIAHLDASLRKLPVERVSDGFTREVMGKLHLVPVSSLGFRMLENAAYAFGLLIVLGVMASVFLWTGVIYLNQPAPGKGNADGLMAEVGGKFADALGAFTKWLTDFFPFAFSKGALGISGSLLVVLVLLLLVDRWVGKRYVQRT